METKKSFSYPWIIMIAILSSPLAFLSPAEALPVGVPNVPCGSLSNPSPGTLCYTITPGGGKASAGGSRQEFSTIIQSTEPEYVIASVVIEVTSAAGERNGPTVNQISSGGQASAVSVATNKLRELRQIKGELQAKATVLAGPALIEAQTKLNALSEEERTFEEVVTKITAAGQDAGKFHVTGSANPRRCGTFNLDKCGSWIEYNIYVVRRYVGDPIAAYNRAFAVAQDAQNTITRLVAQSQPTPNPSPEESNPTDADLISVIELNKLCGKTIYLKSWKGDYLHRPDSDVQKITTWGPTGGSQWSIECLDNGKFQLKSWKGDYLYRPDSDVQKITTWDPTGGSQWAFEVFGKNQVMLKSWKGDYLHRPDSDVQKITTWDPTGGSKWTIYVRQ